MSYDPECPQDQRARVELRLIMLRNMIPPPGWEGDISQLRKAVLADPEIDDAIRRVLSLNNAGMLKQSDYEECAKIQFDRIKAISQQLIS